MKLLLEVHKEMLCLSSVKYQEIIGCLDDQERGEMAQMYLPSMAACAKQFGVE